MSDKNKKAAEMTIYMPEHLRAVPFTNSANINASHPDIVSMDFINISEPGSSFVSRIVMTPPMLKIFANLVNTSLANHEELYGEIKLLSEENNRNIQ